MVEGMRNALRAGHKIIMDSPATPAVAAGNSNVVPPPPTYPAAPSAETGAGRPDPKRRSKPREQSRQRSESGQPAPAKPKLDVPCYFHSAAKYGTGTGCSKGAECGFSHSKFLSKADFEKAERPRSQSAARRESKGAGKGRKGGAAPRSASAPPRKVPFHCNTFLKDGVCPYEAAGKTCRYPHLTQSHYDTKLAEMKAAAASQEAAR